MISVVSAYSVFSVFFQKLVDVGILGVPSIFSEKTKTFARINIELRNARFGPLFQRLD